MTTIVTTGAVQVVTPISLVPRAGDSRDDPFTESEKAEEKEYLSCFWSNRTGSSLAVTRDVRLFRGHCGQRMPIRYKSMIEKFRYISTASPLAQLEPPADVIPMPVFQSTVSIADEGPNPVETAILQELAEIKREVRFIQSQEVTRNASAVPLARAMAMLGCKRSQIFKLLEQRRLERAAMVGRTVMVTIKSIETLLAAGLPQTNSKRSRRPTPRPVSANTKGRISVCETGSTEVKQDPGSAIRNLVV